MTKKVILIFACFLLIAFNVFSKPYKGAELRTKQSFLYGKFEVRMKTANVSGMLSSFFTYHDDDPDYLNNWNEIDIENMGRYSNETQFNVITPGQTNHVYRQKLNFNPHKTFHVYSIEWTPYYISWSIDGYEVYRQVESHISTMFREQKLMMNIWQPASVDWAGAFNSADLPAYAYYDWIKYYKYTPGTNGNFSLDWTDNFDLWDQNRWAKATHTFDGNNTDFITENAVFKDGYMILCLTGSSATGYKGGAIIDKDIDPPYAVSARAYLNEVKINFSEKISLKSAENNENFVIAGVSIKNAKLAGDSQTVILTTENFNPSESYNALVLNIEDNANPKNTLSYQLINIKNSLPFPLAIEAGGNLWNNYLKDQTWSADKEYGYEGGSVILKNGISINGTDEDEVYRSAIDGINFYKIRLPNGIYNITLMFSELSNNLPEARVFDVFFNDKKIMENIDISKEAGINTALDKIINNIQITNNFLEIYFKSKTGKPILNGLKIQKASANKIQEEKKWNNLISPDLNIYPNPFNLSTNFRYSISKTGFVSLKIYDLAGKIISILEEDIKNAGEYNKPWNAKDVSSGVYYGMLVADSKTIIKKIFLIK